MYINILYVFQHRAYTSWILLGFFFLLKDSRDWRGKHFDRNRTQAFSLKDLWTTNEPDTRLNFIRIYLSEFGPFSQSYPLIVA